MTTPTFAWASEDYDPRSEWQTSNWHLCRTGRAHSTGTMLCGYHMRLIRGMVYYENTRDNWFWVHAPKFELCLDCVACIPEIGPPS